MVETALAKEPVSEDDRKVEIHVELTRLLSEAQFSIETLDRLRQSPDWITDQEGHLNVLMHVQETTENIPLIQEQLRQLRELSPAGIDTSMPRDSDQATVDEDFSETQAAPTVQQHWAPQYPTQAGSTPTIQLPDNGANNMKQISPVKRIIGRTKPVPQVALEMPPNGPNWYV
ncbi:hypothetical protein SARC_00744 [Sphaeroforma arctica JP610]|uniref:Uncharacterized protein n=1 Tax=Sphaeroforma arctica JP610 TaxID=667725 RepID=A0A0L0GE20_9EUKA|nr:hypothetical protein SARC_00744 [Sphaeroforma arctica JP610]KNC87121.1 hypothetical protein SARC_00744 [Sphaeroforma arctica JP610]|eukprot:XP_014161023.1 hypothetical protein SARC_00744 [Sphaeroforma arctica JP610]